MCKDITSLPSWFNHPKDVSTGNVADDKVCERRRRSEQIEDDEAQSR